MSTRPEYVAVVRDLLLGVLLHQQPDLEQNVNLKNVRMQSHVTFEMNHQTNNSIPLDLSNVVDIGNIHRPVVVQHVEYHLSGKRYNGVSCEITAKRSQQYNKTQETWV